MTKKQLKRENLLLRNLLKTQKALEIERSATEKKLKELGSGNVDLRQLKKLEVLVEIQEKLLDLGF